MNEWGNGQGLNVGKLLGKKEKRTTVVKCKKRLKQCETYNMHLCGNASHCQVSVLTNSIIGHVITGEGGQTFGQIIHGKDNWLHLFICCKRGQLIIVSDA